MTTTLLIITFFCLGFLFFPIVEILSKKINNNRKKNVEKIYSKNNVEFLIEQVLTNKSNVCPFGNPCIIYDKNKTDNIYNRVVSLMKQNIKGLPDELPILFSECSMLSGSCDINLQK